MLQLLAGLESSIRDGKSLEEFLREYPNLDNSDLVLLISEDQRLRARNSRVPQLEGYLEFLPQLRRDQDAMMDAVVAEQLLREERGVPLTEAECLTRFPYLAPSLRRHFQLQTALDSEMQTHQDTPGTSPSQRDTLRVTVDDTDADSKLGQVPSFVEEITSTDFNYLFEDPALENFDLLKILGCGGMSVVFLARDRQLEREVAIKVLAASVSSDSPQARRLGQEARIVAGLEHPSIVEIFDVRMDQRGLPLLIMEYVEGGNLADRLKQGPLPSEEAVHILIEVASGLAAAHQADLIHRDLKPANILLSKERSPKIADFGLAKRSLALESSISAEHSVVGTPRYMSPEQARGESTPLHAATDIYSLGVILYEMLSGQPPFQAATPWEVVSDILNEDAAPLRQINRRVPRDLESITHRCLHKNSERRYQNAAELRAELLRFQNGEPVHARPVGMASRLAMWCRRNRGVASLAATLAGITVLTAVVSTISAIRLSSANREIVRGQKELAAANTRATNDRNAAVESLNTVITTLYTELAKKPSEAKSKRAVVEAALGGLQRVSRVGDNFQLNRSTIVAQQRMGDLLLVVGDSSLARAEYEKGLLLAELQRESVNESISVSRPSVGSSSGQVSDRFVASLDYVDASESLAKFWIRLGKPDLAQEYVDRCQQVLEVLKKSLPDSEALLQKRVRAVIRQIDIQWIQASFDVALATSLKNVPLVEKLEVAEDSSKSVLLDITHFYQRLGRAHQQTGDTLAGLLPLEKGLAAIEAAQELEPDDKSLQIEKSVLKKLQASMLNSLGKLDEALDSINESIEIVRTLSQQDPYNLQRKFELAATLTIRQTIHENRIDIDSMERDLKSSYEIYVESLEIAPKLESERALAMHSCFMLAFNAFDRSEFESCIEYVERVNTLDQGYDELDLTRGNDATVAKDISSILHEMSLRVLEQWDEAPNDVASATLIAWLTLADARNGVLERLSESTQQYLAAAGFVDLETIDQALSKASSFSITHPMMSLNLIRLRTAIRIQQAKAAAESADLDQAIKDLTLQRALEEYQAAVRKSPIIPGYLATDKDCRWLFTTEAFNSR